MAMSNIQTRNGVGITDHQNGKSERRFLLKIGAVDCPSGNGMPKSESEWGKSSFRSKPTRKSKKGVALPGYMRRDPEAGEMLLIWINENDGGEGLTATARVSGVDHTSARQLSIVACDIRLFPRPRLNRNDLERLCEREVFDDIYRQTVLPLRFLEPEAWEEIVNEARKKTSPLDGETAHPLSTDAGFSTSDETTFSAERQRIWRLQEQRANQGRFRDAVIDRDGERCAVTSCEVVEVLEAAHLIPFATGHADRDKPRNGILLRADIHTLFDRYLMAVDPETKTLWVHETLNKSSYAKLRETLVTTGAAIANLRKHFEDALRNQVDCRG